MTYAIKAKKLLKRINVSAKLIKADENKSDYGCSYGIKIPSKSYYDVIMELKKENISYTIINDDLP